jgi:5-methyltetrahydrofolate--homocysteine methyltransferase
MDKIADGAVTTIVDEQKTRAAHRKNLRANAVKPSIADAANIPQIAPDNPVPVPPFWGRRVVKENLSPRLLFPFINTNALFMGQWGLKKGALSEEQYARLIEDTAIPVFEALQKRALDEGFLEPKVVYGYFPVQSHGNDLIVYHTEEFQQAKCACGIDHTRKIVPHGSPREWLRFTFPRQDGRRKLCVSDFYRGTESGEYDVLGIQLVTVGDKATELAERMRAKNEYQNYLYLHGFGVESAEALAEYWHKYMRTEMGFASEDDPSIKRLFQQKYRGSRYSFGYPACPNLEDRALITQLLKPEEIGVQLTENFMLTPEQSTDAIIAHHPQAKYFDV